MKLKNEKAIKHDPRVRSYTDSDNKTKYRVRFQRTLFDHKIQFDKQDLPSAYAATAWADNALVEANEKRGILKPPLSKNATPSGSIVMFKSIIGNRTLNRTMQPSSGVISCPNLVKYA